MSSRCSTWPSPSGPTALCSCGCSAVRALNDVHAPAGVTSPPPSPRQHHPSPSPNSCAPAQKAGAAPQRPDFQDFAHDFLGKGRTLPMTFLPCSFVLCLKAVSNRLRMASLQKTQAQMGMMFHRHLQCPVQYTGSHQVHPFLKIFRRHTVTVSKYLHQFVHTTFDSEFTSNVSDQFTLFRVLLRVYAPLH